MKQFYFTIILFVLAFAANSQNNLAKETQQKMQEFLQKFPSHQLKSAAADAYALDSITYENGDVKKMTYNSGGLLLTYKYYKNEVGNIVLNEAETNTYNESGQMLTSVVSGYDDWAQKVIDQWKYEYTYNTQGRPVTEIEWVAGNDATYSLEYDSKTTYEYGDDGIIETMLYDWDNGEWKLDVKQLMYVRWGAETYPMVDSSNTFILVEGTTDTWSLVADMTVTYSGDGLTSEMLTIGYDEETGEQSSKIKSETTYNTNGDILTESIKYYYMESMEWVTITRAEYEYNAVNQIIKEEDFGLDFTTELPIAISKITYAYNTNGNLEMRQEFLYYGDEELVLSYKDEFAFKSLDTENIMLPPSSTGIFGNVSDFYDVEFYKNGAIDEVKHYSYSYSETIQDEILEKTGKYHYSEHNSIETSVKQLEDLAIKVFPNPFINEIKIQLDNTGDYQLKLRNSIGQVVYSANINGTATSHNVSELPRGLYILSVLDDEENVANYKLVKE